MSNDERNEQIGGEWFDEMQDEWMEAVTTASLIEAFWWGCVDEFEEDKA